VTTPFSLSPGRGLRLRLRRRTESRASPSSSPVEAHSSSPPAGWCRSTGSRHDHVPVVVVYLLMQRYMVKGLGGAVK
jgi:hypothetical protein